MPDSDYYKILGVSREASDDEIRKAYKKLARKYHPDVKPGDESATEKFKQIQEANAVLGDAEKREQYDRYGAAFQNGGQRRAWASGPDGVGPIDLSDLFGGQFDFGNLFGGAFGQGAAAGAQRHRAGPQAAPPQKGQDIQLEITVPFLVAAEGGSHELQFQRDSKKEQLTVKIPPGLNHRSVIRLAGQGHPGVMNGPAGNLLVTVLVAAHPYFRRDKNNLLLDVPISPAEAVLGAKVDVPTLSEGNVTVTIPPGTSSGAKLRLRDKGIPDRKTAKRGDQFVLVKIVVPKELDEQSRKLYEELSESPDFSPRGDLW
jgi:curved DNA-binding protein